MKNILVAGGTGFVGSKLILNLIEKDPEIDKGLTVHQVAERAIEIWGNGMIVHERDEDAPFEHRLLQVNIDKAKLELGWRPKWSSERAIAETVDWYKRLAGGATAKETSKMQISAFMEE